MKTIYFFFILSILFFGKTFARDEFDTIKCNGDIPKSLVGQKITNDNVKRIETKHKNLNLKNLGGDGTSEDPYILSFWEICGNNYNLLVSKNNLIADVLPIPIALKDFPQSLPGSNCEKNHKKIDAEVFAILEKQTGKPQSTIIQAWKIDKSKMKFVAIVAEGITCESN